MKALILMLLTSCTFSVNIVQSHGQAEDVIDETDSVHSQAEVPLSI